MTMDMAAEVGLLTRNIKIQGDIDTSEENEHGVHISISSAGAETSVGRFSNVEIVRAG